MSLPICQHSFYTDPCVHRAVRHNYVCSEYTINTLLVSLISVAQILLHTSIINSLVFLTSSSSLKFDKIFCNSEFFFACPFCCKILLISLILLERLCMYLHSWILIWRIYLDESLCKKQLVCLALESNSRLWFLLVSFTFTSKSSHYKN